MKKVDNSDFVIEDGVLEKYTGNDSAVRIPVGITAIVSVLREQYLVD